MASKKDYSQMNTKRVYERMDQVLEDPKEGKKPRKTYTAEEREQFEMSMKTIGRKGAKLPRINLAFRPDLYEYVQTMAQVRGQTLTQFCNHIIEQSMIENEEIYRRALEFRNML